MEHLFDEAAIYAHSWNICWRGCNLCYCGRGSNCGKSSYPADCRRVNSRLGQTLCKWFQQTLHLGWDPSRPRHNLPTGTHSPCPGTAGCCGRAVHVSANDLIALNLAPQSLAGRRLSPPMSHLSRACHLQCLVSHAPLHCHVPLNRDLPTAHIHQSTYRPHAICGTPLHGHRGRLQIAENECHRGQL